jgi:glycosyltransferase involved in cell wall biosynthesis
MSNPNKASALRLAHDVVDRRVESALPFAALTKRAGRPLRIAILSDFIRIPYANGTAFQTRFLYRELRKCGHEVTVIGPHDPNAAPEELAPGTVALPSVPMKSYPGLHLPVPSASWIFEPERWNFDVCFAQTATPLVHFGLWLRKMHGTPLLIVNTTHLAAAYDVLLPESLSKIEAVHAGLELVCRRPYERTFRDIYNGSDGLIVLSEGLKEYWRERGVTIPIHVIGRAVQPEVFDKPLGPDPYVAHLPQGARGPRLLCAGRLVREKSQDRVIRIFARHVLRAEKDATLTLLGVGPEIELYKRVAREMGVEDRVLFPGEVPFGQMSDWYSYADVFVHTSQSETYGNVLGEALWCGTPAVAFADGMGASHQIVDGQNGILLSPGKGTSSEAEADAAFGRAVVALLDDPRRRAQLGKNASRHARERCAPHVVQDRIAQAFLHAQEHAATCGLRGAMNGPRTLQWLTTLQHARPWALQQGGVFLAGHMRPARPGKLVVQPPLGR